MAGPCPSLPVRLLVGLTAAGVLAACGGSGSGASTAAAARSTAPPPSAAGAGAGGAGGYGGSTGAAPVAAGTAVAVSETEMSIGLPSPTMTPGTYTFAVHNVGKVTHALKIEGPGVAGQSSGAIGPGQSKSLTVTLTKGSYEFSCPVGNHKSLGMDMQVTVT